MLKDRQVKITAFIVLGIILVALIVGGIVSVVMSSNTVSVTGNALVDVTPDLVAIYLSVENTAATAEEAKDANMDSFSNLKNNLVAIGLDESKIQTTNFNVYEDSEWINGRRVPKGYRATHQIKIELEDDEKDILVEIIDVGISENVMLNYINFELSQELKNEYQAEATKLATQDAKSKAEAIAEGLDKRLGKLISVTDNSFQYSPWPLYEARTDTVSSEDIEKVSMAIENINPSDQQISGRVSVVYSLR